jgi:hypothetical protein
MIYEITQLFDHEHNNTIANERAIEIPLALRYLSEMNGDLVEVGAVTPYYSTSNHKVIDPMDKKSTIKSRAEDYDFTDENVLSISTIEHIGRGRKKYEKPKIKDLAFKVLKKICKESKSCLLSWPMGYNTELDKKVKQNIDDFDYFFYHKKENKEWALSKDLKYFNSKYGKPFRWGNSVIFITKNL